MEIISESIRTAKKVHRCDFCSLPIVFGEKYKDQYNKNDGDAYHWKSHTSCNALARSLEMYERLWYEEGLTQDDFMEYVECALRDIGISDVMTWEEKIAKAKELFLPPAPADGGGESVKGGAS